MFIWTQRRWTTGWCSLMSYSWSSRQLDPEPILHRCLGQGCRSGWGVVSGFLVHCWCSRWMMEWMWVYLLESAGGGDDPTDSDLMGDSSSAAPLAPCQEQCLIPPFWLKSCRISFMSLDKHTCQSPPVWLSVPAWRCLQPRCSAGSRPGGPLGSTEQVYNNT